MADTARSKTTILADRKGEPGNILANQAAASAVNSPAIMNLG
ncbi:hypothetical protein [Hyphomicrobium sp. GJ21]|nr:hypothetical protein [Hyphomicrobium sp. GJ21]